MQRNCEEHKRRVKGSEVGEQDARVVWWKQEVRCNGERTPCCGKRVSGTGVMEIRERVTAVKRGCNAGREGRRGEHAAQRCTCRESVQGRANGE